MSNDATTQSGQPGEHPANNTRVILTINGGSSSIKFALFTPCPTPTLLFSGQVERIGLPGTRLTATRPAPNPPDARPIDAATFSHAAANLIAYLRQRLGDSAIAGIGHRVVHGGANLLDNQIINEDMVAELRRTQPLDLAHLPREIALIEAFRDAFPHLPQVACFDTAFHRDLPHIAKLLPIPRHYFDAGVRRFGFHGLSYTYLMQRLTALAGPDAAHGRVILAHLGSGASMVALCAGKPIDTTMAFTPTAGLVMGTRPGDLDPGLLIYMMHTEGLTYSQMDQFISQKCGLLGVSQTTSDMRELITRRDSDPRAADAVDLFCHQARKYLGAFHAELGGLDQLVFSGGIGEHSPEVRAGICAGLECLGIQLDPAANRAGQDIISSPASPVAVRVIPTDEEIVIAQAVCRLIAPSNIA